MSGRRSKASIRCYKFPVVFWGEDVSSILDVIRFQGGGTKTNEQDIGSFIFRGKFFLLFSFQTNSHLY